MHKTLSVIALLAAGTLWLHLGFEGSRDVANALCLLWIIGLLWLTETFHITVTALLVPLIAVGTGLLDVPNALKNFAHPIVFIFIGGFTLAGAMHVQGLDRWLADSILRIARGRMDRALTMLAAATALLSMWINNTAVTAVMLPLILGMLSQRENLPRRTQTFALLAIAYSASIGGIGTLIGSAPNGIVAAQLGLSFMDWMRIGLPVALLLWPLMMVVLWLVLRPDFLDNQVDVQPADFEWTRERKLLVAIFLFTVTCWMAGLPLAAWLGIGDSMDTLVALNAIVLVAITRVATWQQIERASDWGVVLLFGGGLTLSEVLKTSGASVYLGDNLAQLMAGWGPLLIVFVLVTFVVFLTEFTSNTATTALLVPVFVAMPAVIVEPRVMALAVGICASCAFMLPVATPPNAIVHGTNRLKPGAMQRTGLALNLCCILLLTAVFMAYRSLI